ncbi:MAG: CDP-alcohol phosphatidyltransferase family protein [Phycisphaerales bacterium]|nr:MAG: CDP-alcohol phosphatidyltransferase family protein [Phycisphaerales bacterium]
MPVIAKLSNPPEPGRPRRRRRLRTIQTLPTLLTLGNLLCGLAAIHFCMSAVADAGTGRPVFEKETLNSPFIESVLPSFLSISGFMIVVGMLFDMADGRLARFARRTSNFGGQLDSLADMATFGIAPAVLMITLLTRLPETDLVGLPSRAVWGVAAIYACCAAMRLARFNVEHSGSGSGAHASFHGLPSPGAAFAVASLVILHELPVYGALLLANLLPYVLLGCALLMVSNVRYVHVGTTYLRGRRPFKQFATIVIVLGIFLWQPVPTLATAACAYVLSGPAGAIARRLRQHPAQASAAPDAGQASHQAPSSSEKTG